MTKGIHHITAIASSAKNNLDFYSTYLGLRLVKKTVNQDDTSTYHLFFGDKNGEPGMDLTFFIFLPPMQGRRGNGLVTSISLSVPDDSLLFWEKRFSSLHIKHDALIEKFGKKRITFYDEDDQRVELVGIPPKDFDTHLNIWTTKDISEEHAIRHFHSATLSVTSLSSIEPILTHVLGYKQIKKDGAIHLFETKGSNRANLLEVHEEPSLEFGLNAAGTVHHIAFRVTDEKEQLKFRKRVTELGLYPTEVIDRFYFKSVYFRTPSGILFELATDGPGFTADESEKMLGKKLALPPFLEKERTQIEAGLTPL